MSKVFQHVKAVLIDLSGTLHIDKQAIHGAQTALQRLRESGLKVKFVTNTTKEDLSSLYRRLKSLDFEIEINEIFTSLVAARNLIQRKNVRPYLMLTENAKKDFHGICTDDPSGVVVGLSPEHFNYENMNVAMNLVLNGCSLIAINKARYFKRPLDLALGTGAFVAALEYATDRRAIVVGKPEKEFFLEAIKEWGFNPAECVMIGDDARDDVGGAINTGMLGILVKTGKYRSGDEHLVGLNSDFVATDFVEAVNLILTGK